MSEDAVKNPPHIAFLTKPGTRHLLERFIGARVNPQEVKDFTQDVLSDGVACLNPPAAEEKMVPWILTIAHHHICDHERHQEVVERTLVTQSKDAEEPASPVEKVVPDETLDYQRLPKRLARRYRKEDAQQVVLEWLAMHFIEGHKWDEISKKAGVPAATVKKRSMRYLQILVTAATMFLLMLLVVGPIRQMLRVGPRDDYARHDTLPTDRPDPPPRNMVAAETPGQHAAQLRHDAFVLCDARAWDACVAKLDAARELDPEGDNEQKVQDARAAADAAKAEPKPRVILDDMLKSPNGDKALPR